VDSHGSLREGGGVADVILHSGKLWDGTHLAGRHAIAIRSGKILATGSNEQIAPLRSEETIVVDVGGHRVMPGLIDSHLHLARAGARWSIDPGWIGITGLEAGLDAIADRVRARPAGEWLTVAGGWTPNQLREKRPPTRDDLDRVAPDHPVFVQRNYIEAFVNSRALDVMGWSDHGDGRVVGPMAIQQLRGRLALPSLDEQIEGTASLIDDLRRLGLTGCVDAGGFGMAPAAYAAIERLNSQGLGFRVRLLVGAGSPGDETCQIREWIRLAGARIGDDFLRYLGIGEVLLLDAHDMEGLDERDISAQREALSRLSRDVAEAGLPVHIHAILDSSVSTVLGAWSDLGIDLAPLRFTITHADQIGEANLTQVRDMGLGLTIQNGMAFRGGDSIPTWGEESVRLAPPLRTILEMGIPMAAGTDGTVVSSPNPWTCIEWMVTGVAADGSPPRHESQLLTVDEAMRLYTAGSAWFSYEEESRGNLAPGSDGDVVVLSTDPLTAPGNRLGSIESVLTVVGGVVVHSTLDS
jgi:predicted amidohydrolase YtcJ